MKMVLLTAIIAFITQQSISQSYTARIEPGPCKISADSGLITRCGYLVVPENREKPNGKQIKIAFLFVRKPTADPVRNVTLMSTGGPGYSTINNFKHIPANSGFTKYGGFIFFDQRGTKNSIPCLDCEEVTPAILRAYKEHLPIDSMRIDALTKCRKRLVAKGIDLSSYNTKESAADINDLRIALGLDSLTLVGMSYSGGLMMTVAKNHPEAVKMLILNSPLPQNTNYEEHGLNTMNTALDKVFSNCEIDSVASSAYNGLREKFHRYFSDITGKEFSMKYQHANDAGFTVHYSKQELLDAIINRLDARQVKDLPAVMLQIINGNHQRYVQETIDELYEGDRGLSYGMRLSVYCAGQIAYSNRALVKQQSRVLPWFAGYAFNNVDHPICDCWKVKPEAASAKLPLISQIPALIVAGEIDPMCPPFYNRLIQQTMPNAQSLIFRNRGHVPGVRSGDTDFLDMFLTNPYKKLVSTDKNVTVE
ncbi:alpha/beta hydrolase [Pseudoflavitalea sp. G-6-1-2]|uniref:alpha/beta fold hydrolase n=1 Tax=Pseudoflavitalea sp. G-6-1-2 TaxID=2728841 RepID=UPI00146B8375|nr:alpha/beta fold hydrolase [Pseudoflavitalea sp. G-6-1-2]NML22029.1 alpha/beta hydrolase [Pseudoflavitalea sp. G-6-1-2]